MKKNIKKIYFILIVLFVLGFKTMQSDYYKRVYKSVSKIFMIDNFHLEPVSFLQSDKLHVVTDSNFKAVTTDSIIGYTILDKAKSKFNYFDYLVILDNKLKIKLVKVLVYREDHGNEIQSKRWLKQFINLSKDNQAVLNENIDGISGATISVKSLTNKINQILKELKTIDKNKRND